MSTDNHISPTPDPLADVAMTDKEKKTMSLLVDFWEAYRDLPDARGAETTRVIADAIHIIQGVMAIRVARRVNPEIWR